MGAIADLLKEIPLSAVLRERVKLVEQKYELLEGENSVLKDRVAKLEQENAELRARMPEIPSDDLSDDDKKTPAGLLHAWNDRAGGPFGEPVVENDLNALARRLGMDPDTAHRRSRRRWSRRSWTGGRARRRSRRGCWSRYRRSGKGKV